MAINYFYIEFGTSDFATNFKLEKVGNPTVASPSLQYSTNGSTWYSWTNNYSGYTGSRIYIRANSPNSNGFASSTSDYWHFKIGATGSHVGFVKIGGNIMTLLSKDLSIKKIPNYGFCRLFYNTGGYVENTDTNLFSGCTEVGDYGCYEMFRNCDGFYIAPDLPAMTIGKYCYKSMFHDCDIHIAPTILPATTLAEGCYEWMFGGNNGSTSPRFTTAPELPAQTLVKACYADMFNGCTYLNYVKCLATSRYFDTIYLYNSTDAWLGYTSSSGTFVRDENYRWENRRTVNDIPANWTVIPPFSYTGYTNYIEFKPISNNCTVSLTKVGSPTQTAPQLLYSTDGELWYDWDYSSITLGEDKLYICAKSSNTGFGDPSDGSKYYKFTTTGTFDLGGDIRALINRDASGTTVPSNRCFMRLFEGTGVVNVDSDFLSGYTTLTNRCYARLFYGCTNLVTAPELPVTTVGEASCIEMFRNCTSLITAPELPATTLAYASYANMFQGDTSLTTAPSTLPATALTESCYQSMFQDATSLTTAPVLPAKTLVTNSYARMFSGATSLNVIKCLATDISATNCTQDWVNNVANSGTFIKKASMEDWTIGNNGIPTNWITEDSEMKIQFRKNGQTNWVDSYPTYLPIEASGGSLIYEVKYTYETSNYTVSHNIPPIRWSIQDGWFVDNGSFRIQQYTINYPPSTGRTPESGLISFYLDDNGERIANTLPFSASTLYTSYLYVGDESGSTTTTMEASWQGEHDSDFKTYYWQENIDSFAISADVDWITDIWTDDEDEEIGCHVEPNYGLAPRTGTITVVGTDTIGRTHTCTIVINQDWNVRYPIWQDVYFTGATDTLDYYILMDTGSASREIIYQGRAYLQPNQSNVKINISKICQNYLSNNIEDGNSIRNLDNVNINSMKVFAIFNASGDTQLKAYRYVYDWSYGDLSADGILTKPINGHADSRMVKLGTSVETSLYYRNHSIPSIYTSGYCGDYAIYYLQRNGGWAAFLIEGNSKKTDRYEKYSYNMAFDNNKAMFEESTYHLQITSDWRLTTGWLSDEQSENLAFNLLASNRVFLHDLKNDKIIPVIISNSETEYKTFKNTGRQMVNYTIELRESQKKQSM